MHIISNNTKECYKCHQLIETVRNYTMFFPELKNCPSICSQCLFKVITGDKLEWDDSFKRCLKKEF